MAQKLHPRLLSWLLFLSLLAPDALAAKLIAIQPPSKAGARSRAAIPRTPPQRATRSSDIATTTASSLELFQAGDAYMKLGAFDKAEECFKTAWSRERRDATLDQPTRRKLAVFVGLAHQNNNEPDQAVAFFREAIGKDPKYPMFYYFLAVSEAFARVRRAQDEAAEEGRKEPLQMEPASDMVFESLRHAFALKENLNPGERIPNPRLDPFLSALRHDPRFEAALAEAGPEAEPDLAADLDELTKAGEDASEDMRQAIVEEIEANPPRASELLLRRVGDDSLSEAQRATTVWALGRAGDPRAAEPISRLLFQTEQVALKGVSLEALSRIGGPVAGGALLQELRTAREDNDRFMLLTLLANMQFEPALPMMAELLGQESEQAAHQMAYCFGKMGDKAVPLLLDKAAVGGDTTTRINAINMIAWLSPSRAMIPLQKQYQAEKDPEVRLALMGALSGLMRPDQFEVFLKAALARERDAEAKGVMKEKLGSLGEKKAAFERFKAEKVNDRNLYMATLGALYKSYGRAGRLEDLARTSAALDEPDLQRLRARVLDRQSEECFADYMRINRIIAFNRMIEGGKPAESNVEVHEIKRVNNPLNLDALMKKAAER